MPRRKVSIDSRLIAALLINVPRLVRGHVASPQKVDYVDPDAMVSKIERWFDCPNYAHCLDIAALANWPGWTCSDCGAYADHPNRRKKKRAWSRPGSFNLQNAKGTQ